MGHTHQDPLHRAPARRPHVPPRAPLQVPPAAVSSSDGGRWRLEGLTPAALLALQRTVGNAAVNQLVRAGGACDAAPGAAGAGPACRRVAGPPPVEAMDALVPASMPAPVPGAARPVQRTVYGLATEAKTERYVGLAHDFWADAGNHDKPLHALSSYLVRRVNAMLPYRCRIEYRPSLRASGQFIKESWTLCMNESLFSTRSGVQTVGALTANEVAEVVNTIYHEARHAEQNFLIARRRAGQRQTAQEIAQGLSIPPEVAAAAAGRPLTGDTEATAPRAADAEVWERFIHGTYLDYGLTVLSLDKAALSIMQMPSKGTYLPTFAKTAHEAAYVAYRAFEHERDAFAVGNAAAQAFKAKAGQQTAAPTPTPTASTAAGAQAATPSHLEDAIRTIRDGLNDLESARQKIEQTAQKDHFDADVLQQIAGIRLEFRTVVEQFDAEKAGPATAPAAGPGQGPDAEATATEEHSRFAANLDPIIEYMDKVMGWFNRRYKGSKLLPALTPPLAAIRLQNLSYLQAEKRRIEHLETRTRPDVARLEHIAAITSAFDRFMA